MLNSFLRSWCRLWSFLPIKFLEGMVLIIRRAFQTRIFLHFRFSECLFRIFLPSLISKMNYSLYLFNRCFEVCVKEVEIFQNSGFYDSIYEYNAKISTVTAHFVLFLMFLSQGVEDCWSPWLGKFFEKHLLITSQTSLVEQGSNRS